MCDMCSLLSFSSSFTPWELLLSNCDENESKGVLIEPVSVGLMKTHWYLKTHFTLAQRKTSVCGHAQREASERKIDKHCNMVKMSCSEHVCLMSLCYLLL